MLFMLVITDVVASIIDLSNDFLSKKTKSTYYNENNKKHTVPLTVFARHVVGNRSTKIDSAYRLDARQTVDLQIARLEKISKGL